MGACASCLGLNRKSASDLPENDPLLDDSQVFGYGSTTSQPDEEELRRERDAMDRITNEAAENMINVFQPRVPDSTQPFAQTGTQRSGHSDKSTSAADGDNGDENEEAAWWQSIQSTGVDKDDIIKGLDSGALTLDLNTLKEETSKSAAKRTSKQEFVF